MARAYRNTERGSGGKVNWAEADPPDPAAPAEEWRAWLLETKGPEAFSEDVLDEMRERVCAMPECGSKAVSRSMFCGYHQNSAVGEAGAKELRLLNREMERLGRIRDADEKKRAMGKFRARVAAGDFAILFSGKMQELIRQAGEDAQLTMELGALRVALSRAIQEIDDPREMSLAVSRITNAAARTTRANTAMRKERTEER